MSKAPVPLTEKHVREQLEMNLKAIIKDLPQYKLMVGIPADKNNNKKGGDNIAHYASINEFGSFSKPRIPSRPFMRNTFKGDSMNKISKKAQVLLKQVASENANAKLFMDKLGFMIAGQVRDNITHGDYVPNSKITIAKKGSSKPLIDTGTMRRAITSWVTKK